jgi:hypothetical protein
VRSRYVCFEALAEKTSVYTGDAADLAALRRAAYSYCGVDESAPPDALILELRGGRPASNRTTRRVVNADELVAFAQAYAKRRLGLTAQAVHFASLEYCGQVLAVSRAKVLVGGMRARIHSRRSFGAWLTAPALASIRSQCTVRG